MTTKLFTTGYGGTPEKNTSAKHGQATQIFSLAVDGKKGDIVWASANQEVTTNEDTEPALVWVEFFVAKDANAVAAVLNEHEICGRNGLNITPDMHHYTFTRSGGITLDADGPWNVILAITWDSDLSRDGTIELAGYGKLDAMVFSP